jgi:hypothetical protein
MFDFIVPLTFVDFSSAKNRWEHGRRGSGLDGKSAMGSSLDRVTRAACAFIF